MNEREIYSLDYLTEEVFLLINAKGIRKNIATSVPPMHV